MAPLVQLLVLAIIVCHTAFAQGFIGQELSPADSSDYDDDDVSVYAFAATKSSPLAICSDDKCQNCVPVPEIRVGKLTWPSCAAHNTTDILKDKAGFEDVVSGAKQAFFKIPKPAPDSAMVIRRPFFFTDPLVQNCGMATGVYTKAACAAQPQGEDQFMVQRCSGDSCPAETNPEHPTQPKDGEKPGSPGSRKHPKRAGETQEPNAPRLWDCYGDEENCQALLRHEACVKKDKTLCPAEIHSRGDQGTSLCFEEGKKCVPLQKRKNKKKGVPWPLLICDGGQCQEQFCGDPEEPGCELNPSCPDMKVARPFRGIKADPHNTYGIHVREDLRQRFAEGNNIGWRLGLHRGFGDLGLSSLKPDRDLKLSHDEKTFRGLLFKKCMTERANWLPFGRYKKLDERTHLLGHSSGGSLTAKVQVPWTSSLGLRPNSLQDDSRSLQFIAEVFAAAMHQKEPPCAIYDTRTEKVDAPASKSGYLGLTPILDCTLAMHACGNWMGDPQVHEFCVPILSGKKDALGAVSFVEIN